MLVVPVLTSHAQTNRGVWAFGGAGAGGIFLQTKEPSNVNLGYAEVNKSGYSAHLKGGLGWYFSDSWVIDFATGVKYSSVTGEAPGAGLDSTTVKHTLGLYQLSPRYRFGEDGNSQIGPIYKVYFGSDTDFEEEETTNTVIKPQSHMLGVHFNYDWLSESKNQIYRLGVEVLKDVSDSRNIFFTNIVFEVGFNLWGKDPNEASIFDDDDDNEEPAAGTDVVEPDVDEVDADDNELAEIEKGLASTSFQPVSVSAYGNVVSIYFPDNCFQFRTAQSHIQTPNTRQYLTDLGQYLLRNNTYWEKGYVIGHADRRGPQGREREVNIELSQARARSVYSTLTAAGADGAKLRYEGRAFDEPVKGASDDVQGWRLNRRVELTIYGNEAPEKLLAEIESLNNKYGLGRPGIERP